MEKNISRFVSNLIKLHLQVIPFQTLDCRAGVQRCSVAIIVRFRDTNGIFSQRFNPSLNCERFLTQFLDGVVVPEILFIKRALKESGRWTGHVAFPGGFAHDGETPLQTAERETLEEIGWNLQDEQYFCPIGRLDERHPFRMEKLIVSPIVYLLKSRDALPHKLEENEVAAIRWVPISLFFKKNKEILSSYSMQYPIFSMPGMKRLNEIILPSVYLPKNVEDEGENGEDLDFMLWGLTLGITSEFFQKTLQREPIDNPQYLFNSKLLNFFVHRKYVSKY